MHKSGACFFSVKMKRDDLLNKLAESICGLNSLHPLRIGIDGVDCAGKTGLAAELCLHLQQRGRSVISASLDGFHNPRARRYAQGRTSAIGYYEDSFNLSELLSCLLLPLGEGGDRKYKTVIFDFRKDEPIHCNWQHADEEAILLFDGVFLHRPELLPFWDYTIFVAADFSVTMERALRRDACLFADDTQELVKIYRQRYIPAQEKYLCGCEPEIKANVVVLNNNPQNPELRFNHGLSAQNRLTDNL
jgi:uridine kinase